MIITNEQFKALSQRDRTINVKLKLLDMAENEIGELSGICLGGDLSISASNPIRTNGNIEIAIEDKTFIPSNETKKIWINKKVRVLIYINDIKEPFDYGVFLVDEPDISLDSGTKSLKIQLKDKMCRLDGSMDGYLQNRTIFDAGTPIREVVKALVQLSGETKISIMDTTDEFGNQLTIPMKIEKDGTDTITSVLDEVRDLYMGFEYFYDENGRFIWQKIKDRKHDPVMWSFNEDNKNGFEISYNHKPNWNNIKNVIQIWGKNKDDGTQVQYLIENQSQGQFCIDKIGRKPFVHSDEKIFDNEQAKLQAEYYQFLHSHADEGLTISCVPVYGLGINNIIYVKRDEIEVDGNYRVDDISFGLGCDSTMSITAKKLYYEN